MCCAVSYNLPQRQFCHIKAAQLAYVVAVLSARQRPAAFEQTPGNGWMKLPARGRRWLIISGAAAIVYLLLAYVLLPALWTHHEHEPGLANLPMVTRTADGIPGDALNVGLVGNKEDIIHAMHAAEWFPADPITLRSSIDIVGSVVLDRPYRDAPVSPLYCDGKKEQLAFEKPDGRSPDRRHHVRLWQVLEEGTSGRPVWLGSITFDRGVGLSHDTGQVTHHIGPNIDRPADARLARGTHGRGILPDIRNRTDPDGPEWRGRSLSYRWRNRRRATCCRRRQKNGAAGDVAAAGPDCAQGSGLAQRQF